MKIDYLDDFICRISCEEFYQQELSNLRQTGTNNCGKESPHDVYDSCHPVCSSSWLRRPE